MRFRHDNGQQYARYGYARNYELTGVPTGHVEVDREHSGMF